MLYAMVSFSIYVKLVTVKCAKHLFQIQIKTVTNYQSEDINDSFKRAL